MADGPSAWPGQARALFRSARDNHLCAVSYDPAAQQHRFRDYTCVHLHTYVTHLVAVFACVSPTPAHPIKSIHQPPRHDARAPVVGAGAPLAVSRQEAVWVGDDARLYRLDLDTLALVDHSAATGLLARAPLRLMDRCKVVYAGARDGRLVEESLQGGTQTRWKVTDHTADDAAPCVAGGIGAVCFEVVPQSARVLYRGAGDGRLWELWYGGEAWRLARRDDEEGEGVVALMEASPPPLPPASAGPALKRCRDGGVGVAMTG